MREQAPAQEVLFGPHDAVRRRRTRKFLDCSERAKERLFGVFYLAALRAAVSHIGVQDRFRWNSRRVTMLYYAIVFLIIALIAAFFGFFGVAGLAATIAKVLFVIFIILFIVSLIFGRRGRV